MENPLPPATDLPFMPTHLTQKEFDAKVAEKLLPQNHAINANLDKPYLDDDDMKGYDRSPSQRTEMIIQPHSLLPKPEPPRGMLDRSLSLPETFDSPASATGKFFREKSNSVSAAFKRMSSLTKEDDDAVAGDDLMVKEFNLVGVKVVKTLKEETMYAINSPAERATIVVSSLQARIKGEISPINVPSSSTTATVGRGGDEEMEMKDVEDFVNL